MTTDGTPAILSEATNDRIQDAIYRPLAFAHRETAEPIEHFRARAVAYALHYDDEQLAEMGLGGATFGQAREADSEATHEWTPPFAAPPPAEPPPSPVNYHGRLPWADEPPLAVLAAIVASVAFLLAVISLMVR